MTRYRVVLIFALLFMVTVVSTSQNVRGAENRERDPNRPPCAGESCKKIKRFLKAHYCGKSPYGNGPDDGCDIRVPKKPRAGVHVIADYRCEWNEQKETSVCKQFGQPSAEIADVLRLELKGLGLPTTRSNSIQYRVWSSVSGGWTVAEASYSHAAGSRLALCEVIVVLNQPADLHVVRRVRYQKTNVDVPTVTTWSPIDIADVNGDGHDEVVLEGDSYENHWLEVISVGENLATKTTFSGLGYYL
jgi:hypothetical protein